MNNSSKLFMDKQVTGLPGSQNKDPFSFFNPYGEEQPPQPQQQHITDSMKNEPNEQISPSYDFQPIRAVGGSQSINLESSNNVLGGARVLNSADSVENSTHLRTYGSLDTNESVKISHEKDNAAYYLALVAEIDQTLKKHTDKMLHVFEGVGAQLLQLEGRTHHLENLVEDLKVSVGNNNGKTDGKLRQLENILREVQTGVQVLRDKQDITEAQLQLAKLHTSEGEQQSGNQIGTSKTESASAVSAPHQSYETHQSLDVPQPKQFPTFPTHNAPHLPFQQIPVPVQPPKQLQPESQVPSIPPREPYVFPEQREMLYRFPPAQHPQVPSHHTPQPPFESASQLSQYPQPGPVNPPQPQLPSSHRPDATPYAPSQSYTPSVHQSPSMTQPPSQQFYGVPHMYEGSGYGPPSGPHFSESYPYSGSQSPYGSSAVRPPQLSPPSSAAPSSYQRIPTAQPLPHAHSNSNNSGGTSSCGGSENDVPVDDIVEKVATMGFSREQVRGAVRKLTDNGQSVDLNVVLDKLMNDGNAQPQKGWFGR